MATAYVAFVGIGLLVTIIGIVGLGLGARSVASTKPEDERRLSTHRRRMLLRMLYTRSTAAQ